MICLVSNRRSTLKESELSHLGSPPVLNPFDENALEAALRT